MRIAFVHHRWLIPALALVLSLAPPFTAGAGADAAQVNIVSPGGTQQTLSLEALAGSEDVVARPYALHAPTGHSAQTVTGFSLAAILDAAGADPFGFSYLEVQRPAGGSVLLSRHQALDTDAFADGPPAIYATPAGTAFLRPSNGPEDLNATDSFEAPQGIAIVLRSGEPLQVRARASTVRTRPGEAVAFEAIVDRAGSGEQLTYSWYFDDGHSASGAGARHSFAKPGSYDVVVGVTTPGDDAGASAVVTIQVGTPLSGPDRKGGGRNRDAAAPDHGAATDESDSPPGPGDSQSPTATVPPQPPQVPQPNDRAKRLRPASEAPAGRQVRGLLLSSAETQAPEPTTPPGTRTGKLSADGSGGGLPGVALGLLATAGLLGLGAFVELRGGFVSLSGKNPPRRSTR